MAKKIKTQFKDVKAWIIAAKTGYVTKQEMLELNISEGRMAWMCNADIIKQDKERSDVFILTTAWKREMEKSHGITKCYNYQSYAHDRHIHSKYMSLSDRERYTWKTESEARIEARERMQEQRDYKYLQMLEKDFISSVDAVYTNAEGKEIAFEVITGNYRQKQCDSKFAFCQYMGYTPEIVEV